MSHFKSKRQKNVMTPDIAILINLYREENKRATWRETLKRFDLTEVKETSAAAYCYRVKQGKEVRRPKGGHRQEFVSEYNHLLLMKWC